MRSFHDFSPDLTTFTNPIFYFIFFSKFTNLQVDHTRLVDHSPCSPINQYTIQPRRLVANVKRRLAQTSIYGSNHPRPELGRRGLDSASLHHLVTFFRIWSFLGGAVEERLRWVRWVYGDIFGIEKMRNARRSRFCAHIWHFSPRSPSCTASNFVRSVLQ
jgi:hypothetical protein